MSLRLYGLDCLTLKETLDKKDTNTQGLKCFNHTQKGPHILLTDKHQFFWTMILCVSWHAVQSPKCHSSKKISTWLHLSSLRVFNLPFKE